MSRLKYWQAGLLAFVVSAILFPALPVPEGLSIPQQVLALLALQLAAVSTACIVVLLRTRSGSLQFDLRPVERGASPPGARPPSVSRRPRHLRLVHSRPARPAGE